MDRRLVRRASQALGPTVLALAAFAQLMIFSSSWPGVVTGWAALLVTVYVNVRGRANAPLGRHAGPRAIVAVVFLVAAYEAAEPRWAVLVGGVVVLGALATEGTLRALVGSKFRAANLPAAQETRDSRWWPWAAWLAGLAATAAAGVTVLWPPAAWLVLVSAALTVVSTGGVVVGWYRRRTDRDGELEVMRSALERLQPKFLLYFSAPRDSVFQVTMWLPYLERLGEPFFLLLREGHSLSYLSTVTKAPIVVCPSMRAVEAAIVPSLRAAFYVNNGMKNTHCVRFPQLTHVQLLHGDSDKAPSYNPVTAMYDRVFVAGQAAIDRYAKHGVHIPAEKFRIVGRPQVEALTVTDQPIREVTSPVVLYAPTWIGFYNDTNYSSLVIGERIVRALLDRGATVILRHHPFTMQDRNSAVRLRRIQEVLAADKAKTGREHLWGDRATKEMTLFDCINASHAMVSDVSSVASDFLYTGKPFAITDMLGEGENFAQTFPLSSVAYVVRRDASNLSEVLDLLLGTDPLAEKRRAVRTHYLGDFPPESYAEAFVAEARACLRDDESTPGGSLSASLPAGQPA